MAQYDLHFHFDPVCPFAWITSRWVTQVCRLREYTVDWRFISLRIINRDIDYPTHFPEGYEDSHNAGLRMLRVCAAARSAHGRDVVGPLYTAMGEAQWEVASTGDNGGSERGAPEQVELMLAAAGLPVALAEALHDQSWDAEVEAESEDVLRLTGRDVGTPLIQFRPPDGVAFFGPVISRLPDDADAVRLWDHVIGLAEFPGFAEMKRSLRETLHLPGLGTDGPDQVQEEDWQAGSRRSARPPS